ncbi:MAG TPA: hypothetical protein VHM88_11425 [Candidatus Acidoferrales bacterium]|jgi:type II secretory pathway pseudopilin PulG|nr:hypothetical protein [Candidatus Acidoferrales bacterium]
MNPVGDFLRALVPAHVRALLVVALVGGLAVTLALAGRSWLAVREDRMRLETTIAAQQQIISAAEKREQQRAQQLDGALAQIAELKKTVTTPQQVLRELPRYLPLPQPIQIAPSPGQPADAQQGSARAEKSAPRPPVQGEPPRRESAQGEVEGPGSAGAVAQLPLEDLKSLFDFVQDCRACKLQLAAAQADHADDLTKIAALTKERDAALKNATGGGFWKRTRRAAKWLAVGAAVGYVAAHR